MSDQTIELLTRARNLLSHPGHWADAAQARVRHALSDEIALHLIAVKAQSAGRMLLRQPVSSLAEVSAQIPGGCYCPPGRCSAPVIMGRQTPCLRRPAPTHQPLRWDNPAPDAAQPAIGYAVTVPVHSAAPRPDREAEVEGVMLLAVAFAEAERHYQEALRIDVGVSGAAEKSIDAEAALVAAVRKLAVKDAK